MASMPAFEILSSPIALMLYGYAIVMALVTYLIQPLREKMVDLAESMLVEGHWTDDQRHEINYLLDTATSFRIGIMMWPAIVSYIADTMLGRRKNLTEGQRELGEDARFEELLGRYCISILAANPLAAIVSALLLAVAFLVALLVKGISVRSNLLDVCEEATLRALGAVGAGPPIAKRN